ncbi:MAG TPA: LLM class flavin-dependent oxidoreductase [Candidatus Dormibacteraeota bacterium]|jgi:alkanesulfonate monooxygenase SsuD/methylene tetrahydromethanopterin reductase-like flavin-dependent oxidoreductase (luciferase family)|nr:LLM class flavin-dependent oxidoreductase [Candidatus Dormibacteraeota bacterium]
MAERPFRFGVVGNAQQGPAAWRALALRAEELGYSTLLMPDGLQLLSPWSTLAVAASLTTRLRVGTFVVASPLRPPRLAAWDAHTLSVITEGRFDLGIGTGRPEVQKQAVELLGYSPTTGRQRLAQVEQTIDILRELDGDGHRTPILMAASGPRARALAAVRADIVAVAAPPLASREEVARVTAEIREAAGERADQIELQMNLFVVGDEVPEWTQRFLGADAAALIEHDSLVMLRGGTDQMVEELCRRRKALGVSYISVNAAFFEEMAPVVQALNGR